VRSLPVFSEHLCGALAALTRLKQSAFAGGICVTPRVPFAPIDAPHRSALISCALVWATVRALRLDARRLPLRSIARSHRLSRSNRRRMSSPPCGLRTRPTEGASSRAASMGTLASRAHPLQQSNYSLVTPLPGRQQRARQQLSSTARSTSAPHRLDPSPSSTYGSGPEPACARCGDSTTSSPTRSATTRPTSASCRPSRPALPTCTSRSVAASREHRADKTPLPVCCSSFLHYPADLIGRAALRRARQARREPVALRLPSPKYSTYTPEPQSRIHVPLGLHRADDDPTASFGPMAPSCKGRRGLRRGAGRAFGALERTGMLETTDIFFTLATQGQLAQAGRARQPRQLPTSRPTSLAARHRDGSLVRLTSTTMRSRTKRDAQSTRGE